MTCCPNFFIYKKGFCTISLYLELKKGNYNYFETIRGSKNKMNLTLFVVQLKEGENNLMENYIKNLPSPIKEINPSSEDSNF